MGSKDTASKAFFGRAEIAADLCNGVIYQGEQVVRAEHLAPLPTELMPPGGRGDTESRHRDLLFSCGAYTDSLTDYLILGVEIQSTQDRRMPFRVMEYDARQYMQQFRDRRFRRLQKLLPVVTFVVNLSGSAWTLPTSISGLIGPVAPRLRPFVHDYGMNLLDPFVMDEKTSGVFCTELKTVVDCFRLSGDKKLMRDFLTRMGSRRTVSPEAALLLSNFLEVDLPVKGQKEEVDMCKAMREILKDERDEGRREGMTQGIAKGMTQGIAKGMTQGMIKGKEEERECVISTALERNFSPRAIHQMTGIPMAFILAVREKMQTA